MCGIVAYIGSREAFPVIIKGLHRLEYRGYDSAGVALLNGTLNIYKKAGKVTDLENFVIGKNLHGSLGMGHTRWATHGAPNDINAHPHSSESKNLAIIHNGIIENYAPLKEEMKLRGHNFISDTDTEVLIHLIEDIQDNENISLDEAVRIALTEVVGAFAIVIISKNNPDEIIAARKGSPLVIGVGDNEYFVASDASPIVEYTKNVIYLNDNEIAYIKRDSLIVKNIENKIQTPYIQELELKLEAIEKGGFEHFMLKEIFEQPRSIYDSMRGRINSMDGFISLSGLNEFEEIAKSASHIKIVACGTSWHAGLVAE